MKLGKEHLYEYTMLILAILSVSLIWIDLGVFNYIIFVVWAIFFIDVAIKIYKARSKLLFILKNPFDIVAIIPLDSFFLLARFARFFSVLRLRSFLGRYTLQLKEKIIHFSFLQVTFGFLMTVVVLNLLVISITSMTILEALRWSYLSMYVFDYGKGTDTLSVLIITLLLKLSYVLYVGYLVHRGFDYILSHQDKLYRLLDWLKSRRLGK
jgi:voltage-gated potassium channel